MALKKETIELIAKLTKTKTSDLEAAIKDEKEVDFAIADDLEVLSKSELETRDTTQKKEGEKAGREIGIKEVKKAAGLPEDAPAKDPAKVAQAIIDKAVTDAKVKPDEKVTQLTEQVNLLQTQLSEKDKAIEQATQQAEQVALDRDILAAFPKERSSSLTEKEYLTLIKSEYTFKKVDGKIQVEKDGQVLRDGKTTNPLNVTEAVAHIFSERKGWKSESGGGNDNPGGRGGSGGPGSQKFTKLSEVKKHFQESGKNMLGEEFQQTVAKAIEEYKEFDMNS